MSFLLFLVIAYIIYFVVFKSESFINNSANARTELLEESVIRGRLFQLMAKSLQKLKKIMMAARREFIISERYTHILSAG